VVFEKPQSAAKVRVYALQVLGQLGLGAGTKGLAQGQVEIFPKQDSVEPNGMGSLIALPLGRKSLPIDLVTLELIELEQYEPPEYFALMSPDLPNIAVAQKSPPQKIGANAIPPSDDELVSELGVVADALLHVSAEDFETWVKVGLILKGEFGEDAFETWHNWSKSAVGKYEDEADCRSRWEGLKPNGRATLGTLFHLAKQGRWNGNRPSPFLEMNRRYGILPIGMKTLIIIKKPDHRSLGVFEHMGVKQLTDRYKAEKIIVGTDANGQSIGVPLADTWFASKLASRYTGIEFDPESPPGDNNGYWNIWQGFAVTPKAGSWSRLKEHTYENIANGDNEIFEWLLSWEALGVQKPGMVIGTTPVLRGLQGAGKGIFAHSYGSLFGRHYITVTQSEQVTGRFNGHFFGKRFIFIDEGIFGGNRKDTGVIKTRITEDFVMLEQKGIDAIMVRNHAIFMVASNNFSVVSAEMGDRRWMVLDVGSKQVQNHEYFSKIVDEMNNGGREAMLHELLARDISKGPNPRKVLHTHARVMQILASEAPYIKMLHAYLVEGRLPQNWIAAANTTTIKAMWTELKRDYGDRHMSDMTLGKLIQEIIPGIVTKQNGYFVVGWSGDEAIKERSTQYQLPSLAICRKTFESRMGSKVDWGNDLSEWVPEPMTLAQSGSREEEDLP
jgi:Family of unknown function (DUF5906)/Primase C terminal 2 (PriCT-2)